MERLYAQTEAWKCLGETGINFLTSLFNNIVSSNTIPDGWRCSILVPIYKGKGDIQDCGNYRGIKLTSHTLKIWEKVVERRLREMVNIGEGQYGFMPGKSTTDAIFALRQLMEKYREGQVPLHCVFIDLEKAYDRVPREEIWNYLRLKGVTERYVRLIQDMYRDSQTQVRCADGLSEPFYVTVGLHQGSALSPLLFINIMDCITKDIRRESPWDMTFADDVVSCTETREEAERELEKWREALEIRGMKVSRKKTEYLCTSGGNESETIMIQDDEVRRATVQEDGGSDGNTRKRIQSGWDSWRKITGVLCDKKVPEKVKGKMFKTVVRPALLYSMKTVAMTKTQERKMEVAEMKMLRFSLGVTRLDKCRNEEIRARLGVIELGAKLREARLRWMGHVYRREDDYVGKRVERQMIGRKKRGRPKRRWRDNIRDDLRVIDAQEEDAMNRTSWRQKIRTSDPT